MLLGCPSGTGLMIGVTKTSTGYCGGHLDKSSYEEVCAKTSGHTEAVLIEFNLEK